MDSPRSTCANECGLSCWMNANRQIDEEIFLGAFIHQVVKTLEISIFQGIF